MALDQAGLDAAIAVTDFLIENENLSTLTLTERVLASGGTFKKCKMPTDCTGIIATGIIFDHCDCENIDCSPSPGGTTSNLDDTVWKNGCDMNGAQLIRLTAKRILISRSDANNVNGSESYFDGATIKYGDLKYCDFSQAHMPNWFLKHINPFRTNFKDANIGAMKNIVLEHTPITHAILSDEQLNDLERLKRIEL